MSSSRLSTSQPPTSAARTFLSTLHFYIGLLVGPFIFVAAFTGLMYALTPQLEQWLYADALYTNSEGEPKSLVEQATAAQRYLAEEQHAELSLSSIRPAPGSGDTTRVMFANAQYGPSENRTVFIDPQTLAVKGDLTTYGTSGALPLRMTLDYLHRGLLLGDWGRYYSETAASWLWVMVVGGIVLWATGPRKPKGAAAAHKGSRRRWLHATLGVTLSLGVVFFSLTGMSWSQAAGAHITQWRTSVGWGTPAVSTSLDPHHAAAMHHHGGDPSNRTLSPHPDPMLAMREKGTLQQLDRVAEAARAAGIDPSVMEIRTPKPGAAWSVREYQRKWPTKVDAIALDPATLKVTSRAEFASFPLLAKLIRWTVDFHVGILFGWPNQLLVALMAVGLMTIIGYGYAAWWARKFKLAPPLLSYWVALSHPAKVVWAALALMVGWAFPALGASLAVFLCIDLIRCAVIAANGRSDADQQSLA
ncbi:iron-regulated membrane protein [Carnimonas sp. R-84981]|uniref:PepSY-associated TM helix domain-containing protein n=1 Tax=Carnimonas bestiolae TaxID=3402172 RepID=UPI003EDC6773